MPGEGLTKFNWTIGAATNYEEEVAEKYKYVERGITNRFSGDKLTEAATIEAEGVNTIHTPLEGHYLTLYWIALSSSQENEGEVLATIKIGFQTAYEWYLGNLGQSFEHWEPIKGELSEALTVTLSGKHKVAVAFTYSESVN